jgi:MFS transporter, UMF1 family
VKRWYLDRPVLSWALYDWAAAGFTTTVMAGFFPVFFRLYLSAGADPTTTTFRLGLANGAAGLLIALLAPLLGAMADRRARRKLFLLSFAAAAVLATGALLGVGRGDWQLAAGLFVVAVAGYSGSVVFYDALLLRVAAPQDFNRVSAFGYALGYLGGGLLFTGNVLMYKFPQWFGLHSNTAAVQYSFLTVAVWWLLFSVPLALNVSEGAASGTPAGSFRRTVSVAFAELLVSVRKLRHDRPVWLFLVAYWLYIDGINTIVKMAIDYGMALGFDSGSLLVALLVTQYVAFPAALGFGWLGTRIGAQRAILIGLVMYLLVTAWAVYLHSIEQFFAMAVMVGLVQGGVQSLSRALYGQFVPPGKSAEYFGFYNMTGKFGAVLGPLLVGVTAAVTGSSRSAIGAVAVLFLAGGIVLWRVPKPAAAGP